MSPRPSERPQLYSGIGIKCGANHIDEVYSLDLKRLSLLFRSVASISFLTADDLVQLRSQVSMVV